MTLQELHDSVRVLIEANPKSAHYPVINFDYLRQRSNQAEPVTSHHFLARNGDKELIYDTAEEMAEDGIDDTYIIKKVILL